MKKGKDRPMKVIFTNEQGKRKVVKNSARLKQQPSQDKVAITPDYTICHRENNNKLKSEVAKRRVTDPTFTYRKLKMELSLTNPNHIQSIGIQRQNRCVKGRHMCKKDGTLEYLR